MFVLFVYKYFFRKYNQDFSLNVFENMMFTSTGIGHGDDTTMQPIDLKILNL